jgi:hypothetical protein
MMNLLSQLWRRLLSLLRRGRYEREMEEEMRFHLEMQVEQNLTSGMAPEEAQYAARRQFGNQTWLKEVSREMWSLNSIETLIQRSALRRANVTQESRLHVDRRIDAGAGHWREHRNFQRHQRDPA